MMTADQPNKAIDLGADEGFATFTAAATEVRLDLVQTYNRLQDYGKANAGLPGAEYNAGVVDLMVSWGFPEVSQSVACRFVEAVNNAVADLAKKNLTPAASPAFTASTPSA